MNLTDTIIACASPPGASARGLLRLSGEQAWAIVESMSDSAHRPVPLRRGVRAHRLVNGWPCMMLLFPAPRSYTGQDVIEIALPGNATMIDRAIAMAIDRGARAAEPGEFTARAWMNGRISLTQAEGVAALIAAASDSQLRAAQSLKANRLGRLAADLCERLAAALALVEAGIDFTDEEDVVAIAPADLAQRLESMIEAIDDTLSRSVGSEALSALPRVVLVGPPNAGKSTLCNALLGRSRVVVSAQAGTTRDAVAEPMHLDPADPLSAEVLLIDVAGLDESSDGLNPLMQQAALRAIESADLLLVLTPWGAPLAQSALPARLSGSRAATLAVRSKADLAAGAATPSRGDAVEVSAVTGQGLDALRTLIGRRLADRMAAPGAEALALLPRHEQLLREARIHLSRAGAFVRPKPESPAPPALPQPELIAASMRTALDALGSLAGAVTPDDVLGRIFAGFCVGK